MKLSEVFDPDLIQTDLQAATKEEAVDQLADLFCRKYPEKSKREIIRSVNEREKLGNTSMGRGVAFPHARTDQVTGLYVICGIIPQGLKADTPDGKPLRPERIKTRPGWDTQLFFRPLLIACLILSKFV